MSVRDRTAASISFEKIPNTDALIEWMAGHDITRLSVGFDRIYPVYYEISFELETESERDL
jgi:hypothetical protein